MDQKPKQTLIRVFALVLAAACSLQAAAAAKPAWSFRTLESEHFEVIYREDQKALAKRYILAAEQARELLLTIFTEAPDKTIIYLSDDVDSSNGMASFLPYAMITVYPVLPSPQDSIEDYGDWPFELIAHEYTHILNMYPAHGFYWPLKYIFGGVVRPNAILPKWYLEGLAVNLESHLSDHGRLRADSTQATARALVLGDRLHAETLPRVNEQELNTWPYGSRPYIFGGWWWNSIQGEHGPGVIDTWNQNFARRLPFFINGPMQDQAHKTAEEILEVATGKVETEAKEELAALNASHPHHATALTTEKGSQSVFAISPSGEKLVFLSSLYNFGTTVQVKTRAFPSEPFAEVPARKLFKTVGTTRVSWVDDAHFVFDRLDIDNPYVTYRDLYFYDFNARETRRLTNGLRAQDPAVSPKGEQVAFIENDAGRNHLAVMPLSKDPNPKVRVLLHGNYLQRLSGPEFLNENEILFVMRVRSGQERLYVYNLKEKTSRPWNATLDSVHSPRRTPKGIVVTASPTHVRNAYLVKAGSEEPTALSNTLTAVEVAGYDPGRDELLFTELSATGSNLQSAPWQAYTPSPLEPPKMDAPPLPKTSNVKVSEGDYQPLKYLVPQYWIPFVYTVENGGLLFTGSTSTHDPAGRNSYSLFGAIDTVTKKPSYGFGYTNSSLPTDLNLGYSNTTSYLGASSLTLQSETLSAAVAGRWPFDRRDLQWAVGGLTNTLKSQITYKRVGPTAGVVFNRMDNPLNGWNGFMFEVLQQQFVKASAQDTVYGRTYAHLQDAVQLGGGNRVFFQARGALAPNLPFQNVIDLGDSNVGGNYPVNLANSVFLLRGYPSGNFIGRKILNANLEFSLPAWQLAGGYGSFPFFAKALELAVFTDALSVDGGAFAPAQNLYFRSTLDHYFMSTGAELRLSATAGYHLPISFILGAYYGLNHQYGGGFTPFFAFGSGDLGALQNKTP